jgi:hypothetical protein
MIRVFYIQYSEMTKPDKNVLIYHNFMTDTEREREGKRISSCSGSGSKLNQMNLEWEKGTVGYSLKKLNSELRICLNFLNIWCAAKYTQIKKYAFIKKFKVNLINIKLNISQKAYLYFRNCTFVYKNLQ